jgi:inosose dehydratase
VSNGPEHTPRLAGAPISWGVCEVPGWGVQLSPDRVLSEMAALGIRATELGALGWLPLDGSAVKSTLGRYGLRLVGGFVPVNLREDEGDHVRKASAQLAEAGGEMFVAAAVQDQRWSTPVPLDAEGWKRAGEHLHALAEQVSQDGLTLVLHPHADTVLETAQDIALALEHTGVPWCFDTGHLVIGGVDPAQFVRDHADRIGHVHLKDVDAKLAEGVRAKRLPLVQAVQAGLFKPLGEGDARIDEVIRVLDDTGYERWLVLEQDVAITGPEPPVDGGPALDVARSLEFLSTPAPRRERVSLS